MATHETFGSPQLATLAELRTIRDADPDGKETEPTEADYKAFEEWVVRVYGRPAYEQYMNGNWEPGPDV